jgi:leucyl-tRNA synthetase
MKHYNHISIEGKWQREWAKKKLYEASDTSKKPPFYGLIEFPYPSGDGLHVGHIRSNTAMDIIARKRRAEGFEVLYPIGYDAFGLPTENYAIKTGIAPKIVTKKNTANFRKQLKSLGFSFDWSREINTSDPSYYRWTQWIFLQFLKKGLAYKKRMFINWCPQDKIGLANEEVIDGKCERCGSPVEKREKEQWMLAITKYADRLDKDLDTVEFLEKIKIQQRNWIGRSVGATITFKIVAPNLEQSVDVFTTRPDTLFGVSYVVLSPEHPLVGIIGEKVSNAGAIRAYVKEASVKTEIDRTDVSKEKTGVVLEGVFAVNPVNGARVPVYVADYVLAHYGTGAVMAVPAHDERDFAFAKRYDLPVKHVIAPYFTEKEGGKDAVRPDKKTVKRKTAYVLLLNKNKNTFLCLDWPKFGWHSGIIGGVDSGEDYKDAAIREIYEETGYKNIRFVRELGEEQYNHFFAAHKDENRYAVGKGMLFELVDETHEPVKAEHAKHHTPVWIKADEMGTWLNLSAFKYMWNVYSTESDCYTEKGILFNSGVLDGKTSDEAMTAITELAGGKLTVTYRLKDWVFSRQRYWGEPIPVVHCNTCGIVPVPEKELPVTLPEVKNYAPTDTGESPLASIKKWVNTKCPTCKGPAKRETDTMPNWAGSSWYYLRYADADNTKTFADKKKLARWTPVSWYNGGMEHTTLHLLYSRFWHKFLFDLGLVPTAEPYTKRTSHGLILAEGGVKMSKSKGNVINPDSIVKTVGADALRLYEMFMAPFDQPVAWSNDGVVGTRRFVERVWNLYEKNKHKSSVVVSEKMTALFHLTTKKVSEDIEAMKFNTAVSSLMVLANAMEKEVFGRNEYEWFLKLLSPFAPHVTEELWHMLGNKKSVHLAPWPQFDVAKMQTEEVTLAVQVNGKLRATFTPSDAESDDTVRREALSLPDVSKWIAGKEVKKVIVIKRKIVSIVVV